MANFLVPTLSLAPMLELQQKIRSIFQFFAYSYFRKYAYKKATAFIAVAFNLYI